MINIRSEQVARLVAALITLADAKKAEALANALRAAPSTDVREAYNKAVRKLV